MSRLILPLFLLLAACNTGPEPHMVLEMNCEACGTNGEDVQQGCDACQQMADKAMKQPRPNIDRARSLYAKGCQVHYPAACNSLAIMVRDGKGGPRDLKRAGDLFTIACEKGDIQSACTEQALALYDGVGLKQNRERAVELFESSCDHETDPQPKSCAALGLAWLSGDGVEKKDEDLAIELLERSCEADYAAGCVQVGDLFAERSKGKKVENQEIAAAAYEKACKLDARHGCYELAEMHREGDAPEPSDEKSAIYFQKTCNIDPTRGCYEAAELMAEGKVSAREGEIESLYNIACDHGHTAACAKRSIE